MIKTPANQIDYPLAFVDREDIESGVFLVRNEAEMRQHILDDLGYMRDDEDEGDAAEFARLEALDTDALIGEYLSIDSDWLMVSVYTQDVEPPMA
jgi:hypothetical protein